MKRFVSIIAFLLILFSCNAAVFAAKPKLEIQKVSGRAGETVRVDVSIVNNTGFAAAKFIVTYDEASLTLLDLEPGMLNGLSNPDYGIINHASLSNVKKDGVLFTAVFRILDGASGNCEIAVTTDTFATTESQMTDIPEAKGSIRVERSSNGGKNTDPAGDDPGTGPEEERPEEKDGYTVLYIGMGVAAAVLIGAVATVLVRRKKENHE